MKQLTDEQADKVHATLILGFLIHRDCEDFEREMFAL